MRRKLVFALIGLLVIAAVIIINQFAALNKLSNIKDESQKSDNQLCVENKPTQTNINEPKEIDKPKITQISDPGVEDQFSADEKNLYYLISTASSSFLMNVVTGKKIDIDYHIYQDWGNSFESAKKLIFIAEKDKKIFAYNARTNSAVPIINPSTKTQFVLGKNEVLFPNVSINEPNSYYLNFITTDGIENEIGMDGVVSKRGYYFNGEKNRVLNSLVNDEDGKDYHCASYDFKKQMRVEYVCGFDVPPNIPIILWDLDRKHELKTVIDGSDFNLSNDLQTLYGITRVYFAEPYIVVSYFGGENRCNLTLIDSKNEYKKIKVNISQDICDKYERNGAYSYAYIPEKKVLLTGLANGLLIYDLDDNFNVIKDTLVADKDAYMNFMSYFNGKVYWENGYNQKVMNMYNLETGKLRKIEYPEVGLLDLVLINSF